MWELAISVNTTHPAQENGVGDRKRESGIEEKKRPFSVS